MGFELIFEDCLDVNSISSKYAADDEIVLKKMESIFIENIFLLTDFIPNPNLIIKVKFKTYSGSNHLAFATFIANESDSSKFSFDLFQPMIDLVASNNNLDILKFKRIVLHELIHALDISILKENIYEYKNNKPRILTISNQSLNVHKSVQWCFIHLLATIRNEGVALLGEKLFGDLKETISDQKAFELFENDFNLAVSLCLNSSFHNKINLDELNAILARVKNNCYQYADVLLFNFLNKKKHSGFQDLQTYLVEYENNANNRNLLFAAFDFDLSEWIREVFKIEFHQSDLFKINHCKLTDLCDFLEVDQDSDLSGTYYKKALQYAYSGDIIQFIEVVQSNVIEKLTSQLIADNLKKALDAEFLHDIENDIFDLATTLFELRDERNKDVIDWSLSYLFNKKDMIHDDLSFLGLQDDWMILEGANILIELNKNMRSL